MLKLLDKPVVLKFFWNQKGIDSDVFYNYYGDLTNCKKLNISDVATYNNKYEKSDEEQYRSYQGWLVKFDVIGQGVKEWALFAHENQIYLDFGSGPICFNPDKIRITYKKFLNFAKIEIFYIEKKIKRVYYTKIPFRYWVFADGMSLEENGSKVLLFIRYINDFKQKTAIEKSWSKGRPLDRIYYLNK